ncbi:hypothetical protein BCU45_021170 [Vibrio lentus]|uniref:hypothetical protein n=1 Tax=Vibrio lentus TaxID=136468 RepID=UPI000C8570BD|nr:hypothetical protein [Vibrio lentus]PMI65952.1 hypothetical protein BCU40_11425 [Vibrio lentus]
MTSLTLVKLMSSSDWVSGLLRIKSIVIPDSDESVVGNLRLCAEIPDTSSLSSGMTSLTLVKLMSSSDWVSGLLRIKIIVIPESDKGA